MEPASPGSGGILESVRSLGDSLLAAMKDRVELFSLELQEEKFRVIRIFTWISAAVFTGMMVITFASITVVYLFWESARLAVLGGLTLFYAVLLACILIGFARFLKNQPVPFAATLQEIRGDRACIRPKS